VAAQTHACAGEPLRRTLVAAAAALWTAALARATPQPPVITEPSVDGEVISPFDVHMVAGPFVGAAGEVHLCSDWEIRTVPSDVLVWTAVCATGTSAVHIHLGDGAFVGPLAGRNQLSAGSQYELRVRFKGSDPPPDGSYSDWSVRHFATYADTAPEPLVLSDVALIAAPSWRDETGAEVALPAGSPSPTLTLQTSAGILLRWKAGLAAPENPSALDAHGSLRVVLSAGGAALTLPPTILTFTDGSGTDREVYLPATVLAASQTAAWWVSEIGAAFTDATGGAEGATEDFSTPVTEPPVPWAVRQPGYRVERAATGFRLPVDIAFVPSPGSDPDSPFFYVTELYGSIAVVTRSGVVSEYATNLLNFDPTGPFPGSGEKGVTGIAVDPTNGDVVASMQYAVPPETSFHFPEVMRLTSTDGGRTAATRTPMLQWPNEPQGASHQISHLSFGPDGDLYIHVGDGLLTTPALDMSSVRGKILRVLPDGSAPPDNPFYDASDGFGAADLIFALGLRNPFGGAWREADGKLWEVENGPSVDRLARVDAGANYGWNGTDDSMHTRAAYNWFPPVAPVNLAWVQPGTFGGSGFPAGKMDHAFVTESGATYAEGPETNGKRISELAFDLTGALVSGPSPLVEYAGVGRGTAVGLAAGPDGLYFTDLYKDFGGASPTDPGASVFRVRWVGVVDFTAAAQSGPAPLTVSFQESSTVPSPTAWHWEFGDGSSSDEHAPVHQYVLPGVYDVRLTVTGSAGQVQVVRQKGALITVEPGTRTVERPPGQRPPTRTLEPRPTP
jgi:glucose/arabinose dehydrogenase